MTIKPQLGGALDQVRIEPLDHTKVKLGAWVGGGDPRIPLLARYSDTSVQVPTEVHRSHREFEWPMLANDTVGDCVVADMYHGIQHMDLCAGNAVPAITDDVALGVYSAIGGYDPNDPSTDQGLDPVQAWAYWQQTGLPLPDGQTDRIDGAVQVLPNDGANFKRGIWEFDGAGMAISMPVTAQAQTSNGEVWDVVGDPNSNPDAQPGSWGGHMVRGVSYDRHRIAIYTWGMVRLLTWRFWGTYGQLALFGADKDQLGKSGRTDTGVRRAALLRDLPQL